MIVRLTLICCLVLIGLGSANAQSQGKACFQSCQQELTRTNGWKTLPRGYCREKCSYYAGAPTDVLKKAGREPTSADACLQSCRDKVRAIPGFQQDPKNRRYCKDKCGTP